MKGRKRILAAVVGAVVGAAGVVGSVAIAEPSKEAKAVAAPAGQAEMKLPPGWTEADVQAMIAAGTPGKMHEHLAKGVGVWQGTCTAWMVPGGEPMPSECTWTVTSLMGGKFIRCEMAGEMPGMGPYSGQGTYGFDNVTGKFVSSWIDNCTTGILSGEGELSPDGKTLTWTYTVNCPIDKKPRPLREVETITGPNTKRYETFGPDPKTGKEFKMMVMELTRK